mmetsp:Transcript_31292/g.90830  ORF Transcript_31292/g.90830 Transcript_31292/m.90830 type:complete len:412 (-) Transcript_31292:67-1302(-)
MFPDVEDQLLDRVENLVVCGGGHVVVTRVRPAGEVADACVESYHHLYFGVLVEFVQQADNQKGRVLVDAPNQRTGPQLASALLCVGVYVGEAALIVLLQEVQALGQLAALVTTQVTVPGSSAPALLHGPFGEEGHHVVIEELLPELPLDFAKPPRLAALEELPDPPVFGEQSHLRVDDPALQLRKLGVLRTRQRLNESHEMEVCLDGDEAGDLGVEDLPRVGQSKIGAAYQQRLWRSGVLGPLPIDHRGRRQLANERTPIFVPYSRQQGLQCLVPESPEPRPQHVIWLLASSDLPLPLPQLVTRMQHAFPVPTQVRQDARLVHAPLTTLRLPQTPRCSFPDELTAHRADARPHLGPAGLQGEWEGEGEVEPVACGGPVSGAVGLVPGVGLDALVHVSVGGAAEGEGKGVQP